MANTLYDIDYIIIDYEKTFDNSTSMQLDRAISRERIMHRSGGQFIIEIPYIRGTKYFFSDDFDTYTYNQCDIDTLIMLGLVKELKPKTHDLIEHALFQNRIINERRNR